MATVLLIVIYMAFISLGLPDSVLGTAWPMMHIDINAPVNVALVLFSLPLGLGGGAIDTALNNYVAKHYSAMQMNFLHAFWGIGTIIAPFLLSIYFDSGKTWRDGYHVLAAIQIAIFFIVLFSSQLNDISRHHRRKDSICIHS